MTSDLSPQMLALAEQQFTDPVLDAEVVLKVVRGSSEPFRIRVKFSDSTEVHELRFDAEGRLSGSGVLTPSVPEPVPRIRLVR